MKGEEGLFRLCLHLVPVYKYVLHLNLIWQLKWLKIKTNQLSSCLYLLFLVINYEWQNTMKKKFKTGHKQITVNKIIKWNQLNFAICKTLAACYYFRAFLTRLLIWCNYLHIASTRQNYAHIICCHSDTLGRVLEVRQWNTQGYLTMILNTTNKSQRTYWNDFSCWKNPKRLIYQG